MRKTSLLWVVLSSLLLVACGGGGSSSSGGSGSGGVNNEPTKIVALGDSIGARELSWPTVVGQMSGVSVANYSRDSLKTSDFVGRVEGILAKEKPSHLMILLGTNDARGGSVSGAVSNLQVMVNIANSMGVTAIVGTIPPNFRSASEDARAAAISSGVHNLNGARVALVRENLGGNSSYFPDGLHPNSAGSRVIGSAFNDRL